MKEEKKTKANDGIKMKAGLEIHQQLDTGKLFCRCPSILRNEKGDWIVKRKLHAVAGESGEVDVAAQHEVKKDKEFVYEGFRDTCCLVEFDEQPPLELDREALKVVCQVALFLNCEILPIAQIMRKTVIDGSNTSGFQRTVMIAKNGFVETSFGRVGINGVFLEEDSARIIENNEKQSIYRLDRLGIPLIEIATAPDIYFPEQVKECALKIGEILRACKVKRGIGTIRQDLNISTPGHPRVEIKGFQDPRMMVKTVELEIERQQKEIIKSEKDKKVKLISAVRKANEDGSTSFLRPMPGADRMYPETDLPLLKIGREFINRVKEDLPSMKSEILEKLKTRGLTDEMINLVLDSGKLGEYENLLKIYDNPNFVAKLMFILPKEIASHEKISEEKIREKLGLDVIENILKSLNSKKILETDAKHVFEKIVKGSSVEEALKIEKADLSEIETEAARIIKEKPGLSSGAYMGLLMGKFKGKISGKEASEIIGKLIK